MPRRVRRENLTGTSSMDGALSLLLIAYSLFDGVLGTGGGGRGGGSLPRDPPGEPGDGTLDGGGMAEDCGLVVWLVASAACSACPASLVAALGPAVAAPFASISAPAAGAAAAAPPAVVPLDAAPALTRCPGTRGGRRGGRTTR